MDSSEDGPDAGTDPDGDIDADTDVTAPAANATANSVSGASPSPAATARRTCSALLRTSTVIRFSWPTAPHRCNRAGTTSIEYADADTVNGYIEGDANPVFTLDLTDTATGAYTFTLYSKLDHHDVGDSQEDTITIGLNDVVEVTDAGNPDAPTKLDAQITVIDDVPVARDDSATVRHRQRSAQLQPDARCSTCRSAWTSRLAQTDAARRRTDGADKSDQLL